MGRRAQAQPGPGRVRSLSPGLSGWEFSSFLSCFFFPKCLKSTSYILETRKKILRSPSMLVCYVALALKFIISLINNKMVLWLKLPWFRILGQGVHSITSTRKCSFHLGHSTGEGSALVHAVPLRSRCTEANRTRNWPRQHDPNRQEVSPRLSEGTRPLKDCSSHQHKTTPLGF